MKRLWLMANWVACGVVGALLPVGCGGAPEEPHFAQNEAVPIAIKETPPSVEVPDATVRKMTACVQQMSHTAMDPSVAFQYDLGANERGKVLTVALHDATERDTSLEACFKQALEAMVVPDEALRLRSSKPFSGGERTYSSRGQVGVVQAVVAPIALAPIVIPALGVTILVAISVTIIRDAVSGPDCNEVKEDCIVACNGKLPTGDFGFRFWNCVNRCMRTAGC